MTKRGPSHIRDRHRVQIARAQPPCHLCGAAIDYALPSSDPMAYVVDHVVPLKLGGDDTIQNKSAAHRLCNSVKGAREFAPILRRSSALIQP